MYYSFVKCVLPEHSAISEMDSVHTTDDVTSGFAMAVESMMENDIVGPVTLTGQSDGYVGQQFPWHRPLHCTNDSDHTESDVDDMMSDIVVSSVRAVDGLMSEDEPSLLSDTSHVSEDVWSFPTEQNADIGQYCEDKAGSGCLENLRNHYQTPLTGHGEAIHAEILNELLSEDELLEEGYDEGLLALMGHAKEDDTESLYDF